jgi:hypothetical protein
VRAFDGGRRVDTCRAYAWWFLELAHILFFGCRHDDAYIKRRHVCSLITMADLDPLPVPAQLQTQLAKCKSVRKPDYHKSREKTPEVSSWKQWHSFAACLCCRRSNVYSVPFLNNTDRKLKHLRPSFLLYQQRQSKRDDKIAADTWSFIHRAIERTMYNKISGSVDGESGHDLYSRLTWRYYLILRKMTLFLLYYIQCIVNDTLVYYLWNLSMKSLMPLFLVSLRNLNLSMESSAAIPDAYSSIKRAAGIAAPKSSRARMTKERFGKQMR